MCGMPVMSDDWSGLVPWPESWPCAAKLLWRGGQGDRSEAGQCTDIEGERPWKLLGRMPLGKGNAGPGCSRAATEMSRPLEERPDRVSTR